MSTPIIIGPQRPPTGRRLRAVSVFLCMLVTWGLWACTAKKEEAASEPPPQDMAQVASEAAPSPEELPATTAAGSGVFPSRAVIKRPTSSVAPLQSYAVKVSSDEHLQYPGPPGELKVWIGIESQVPVTQPGKVSSVKPLHVAGQTARVTPVALGIEVEPKTSVCARIDPSGSEVSFQLKPTNSGSFKVGADIALFDSPDCSGSPVPKSTDRITVEVTVNSKEIAKKATADMGASAWKAFMGFWDKLLLLVFGLILFLIRKKIARLFGFGKDGE